MIEKKCKVSIMMKTSTWNHARLHAHAHIARQKLPATTTRAGRRREMFHETARGPRKLVVPEGCWLVARATSDFGNVRSDLD
jgi:hypothetical protein